MATNTADQLIDFAQHFSAHALAPRLAPGHHPFGRGENVDSHATQYARDLVAPHVDPPSGTRDALQPRHHRRVVIAILQVKPQDLAAVFLSGLEVRNVSFFLQNAGNLQFQLGSGDVHFLVPGVYRIANARQEICDGIGQTHLLLLLTALMWHSRYRLCAKSLLTRTTWKRPEFRRAAPARGSTGGRCRTCAKIPAADRKWNNGCAAARKTWASFLPSLLLM